MPIANVNFTASGNIRPSRFVTLDNSAPLTISEVNAVTEYIVGVMQEGVRWAPGTPAEITYAAEAGDTLFHVYGPGEVCYVYTGENVSAGDLLKSNTSGLAVKLSLTENSTYQMMGGQALETAESGKLVKIMVRPGVVGRMA